MTSASSLLRSLLIYSICIPVAIFLGYVIAQEGNPLYTPYTYFGIGPILFVLALPLLLRWHHGWLIASWNLGAVLFFLPGRPELWMGMTWLSLLISIIQYILNRRLQFLNVPGITRSLLFLGIVVFVTAECNGGIGLAAFGSHVQGGKRYLLLFTAIAGYFALTSQPIPPRRATFYVNLFFLGSLTLAIGELGSMLPESFYFIYLLFPISEHGLFSIINSPTVGTAITRLGGLAAASSGVFCAILAHYGIRELLTPRRIFQLLLLATFAAMSLLGGYRSVLLTLMLTFAIVFYLEGLMRSRYLPLMLVATILASAGLVAFVDRLPLNVQRALSVLPLPVDAMAKRDAEASSEWRVNIWKHLVPQIPQYLLVGKGLGFNASDLRSFTTVRPTSGLSDLSVEGEELVADYHNGPLSVILPFGIFGVIGFLWFLASSLRVLSQNFRYGHPAYHRLNTFLYGYFIAKTIFFFAVFGNFYSELLMFTGVVGLSVSLNGGVAKRMILVPARLRQQPPHPMPGARKPTAVAA